MSSGTTTTSSVNNSSDRPQYSKKRERTRARLVAAATAVVADRGIDEATIGAIADEAGMVSGTIYHHFGGRDALISEVVDGMVSVVADGLHQVRQADDDPAIRIALAAVGLMDRAVADRHFGRAFGRLLRSSSELQETLADQVGDVVQMGVDSGRFTVAAGTERLSVDVLLAIASSAALRTASGELGRRDRASVAALMLATVGLDHVEAGRSGRSACAMIDAIIIEAAGASGSSPEQGGST